MDLRAWQHEALAAIRDWDGTPAIIRAVMGAGKSVVIARACEMYPSPVVIAVPSIHLVEQLREDIPHAGAYYTSSKTVAPTTITTYASLAEVAERVTGCELLVCDEAHQSENPRAIAAISKLAPKRILGFTATDWRANSRESLSIFKTKLINYGPSDALRDGVVVPFEVIPHTGDEADLDTVAIAMTRDAIARGATLVNAWDTDDADRFAARLRAEGIRAESVHSKKSGKAATLERLRLGEIDAVVHVDQLREGVNLPWLVCLVARRQRSRVGFPQEVGRILRSYPGKDRAYIYDPLDLFGSLGLDYEACLGGESAASIDDVIVPCEVISAVKRFRESCKSTPGYSAEQVVTIALREAPTTEAWMDLCRTCGVVRWDVRISKPRTLELPPAVAIDAARALIRQLAIAWRSAGAIPQIEARSWRAMPPTDRQLGGLGRMAWTAKRIKSPEWELVVQTASEGHYDRGTTSDVWSILRASEAHGWCLWPTV